MYTFDTNAVIYYVKGDETAAPTIAKIVTRQQAIYISTITEIELFPFSGLTDNEAAAIEGLLQTVSIIPIDSNLALMAARVRSVYHLRVPDSVIAATALFTGTKLVTRITRDFKRVNGLEIEAI